MNIYEKLSKIQNKLKVAKSQTNTFGNYSYRSCEDILEAVKPLCIENKCVLVITDEIRNLGERFYVEAVATLISTEEKEESISNKAFARESLTKKGMDESQITGACSSYARKYALNGLFCIDDTKDADTDDFAKRTKEDTNADNLITRGEAEGIVKHLLDNGYTDDKVSEILGKYGYAKTSDIKVKDFRNICVDFKMIK